jgi:hypothetical protein
MFLDAPRDSGAGLGVRRPSVRPPPNVVRLTSGRQNNLGDARRLPEPRPYRVWDVAMGELRCGLNIEPLVRGKAGRGWGNRSLQAYERSKPIASDCDVLTADQRRPSCSTIVHRFNEYNSRTN